MASKFEKATERMEQATAAPTAETPRRGYRLIRESKKIPVSILIRESTRDALDEIQAEQGKSRNEIINNILEEYIEKYYG